MTGGSPGGGQGEVSVTVMVWTSAERSIDAPVRRCDMLDLGVIGRS